jgi:hypothetical protein
MLATLAMLGTCVVFERLGMGMLGALDGMLGTLVALEIEVLLNASWLEVATEDEGDSVSGVSCSGKLYLLSAMTVGEGWGNHNSIDTAGLFCEDGRRQMSRSQSRR